MNRTARLLVSWLVLSLILLPAAAPVRAGQSDISLFAGGGALAPNIVIMLDSSGSMNNPPSSGGALTKKQIAISALTNLVTNVNPLISGTTYEENARFGLFTFRDDGALLNQSISPGNTQAVLNAISSHASSSVGTPVSASILDVGRYYAAGEAWGTLDAWGTRTSEPAVTDPFDYSCRESFAISITDGLPNGDAIAVGGFWATIGDSDGDAGVGENGAETLANVGVNDIEWGDDITKAMFERDFDSVLEGQQNVVTHVIGFDVNSGNLQRMADNGGGLFRTTNSAAGLASVLAEVTQATFDDLASYSTAVVPTSRTSFGSAFYNAYFEPDENDAFWEGHIEAYDISPSGEILDASGSPAIDASTDEFNNPPNPHWDAGVRLRSNSSRNLYTTLANARTDFTNTAAIRAALGVTAAEIPLFPNSAGSGISTQTQAEDAVINYLRGEDAFDQDNDADSAELRSKVLGDIFHSTPIIVGEPSTLLMGETGFAAFRNNPTYRDRKRVLYAGANDGMFHAFDAGTLTTGDNPLTPAIETSAVFYTPGSGDELFGYVPGLLLDDVKLVPRNNPRTYYFVDGSPVVSDVWLRSAAGDYSRDTDEWTTISIVGFREGGAGYLALDVTDPAAATSLVAHGPYPKYLWEFTDATLGQAWSEPIITRVRVREGSVGDVCGANDGDGNCRERWVAIFGGGYDTSADPNHPDFAATSADAGWTLRSKAIFMVDLATGTVLDKVAYDSATNPNMIYALPSRPAVLDTDFDGFADVVYIGDLGGQMWKWDISAIGDDTVGSDGIIDNWAHGIFFASGSASDGSQTRYRSFFYPPVATFVRNRLVLSFATGEREQLEYEGAAGFDENNRVYVIKDFFPTGGSAFAYTYGEIDLTDITSIPADNDLTDQGYYFVVADGEKFVSDVALFAGFVILVSFDIDSTSSDPCAAASGVSKLYVFDVRRGAGYFSTGATTPMEERYEDVGGGLASTPRISIAPDPDDDKMYVKTSKGRVITIDPPPRPDSGSSMIYWRENR